MPQRVGGAPSALVISSSGTTARSCATRMAQRQAPGGGVLLVGILHHLHRHRGRGDRQHAADHRAAQHFAMHQAR